MDVKKLFETQRKLDERITKEKGLQGQDLLDEKILALQVEIGELAQNWRGFKFWSNDQEPRTKIFDEDDEIHMEGILKNKNPLLEEYVDCLHFILSIGLEVGAYRFEQVSLDPLYKESDVTKQFLQVIDLAIGLRDDDYFLELLQVFMYLGEMLGFTDEQVEQAYYDKNKTNHERQENGY